MKQRYFYLLVIILFASNSYGQIIQTYVRFTPNRLSTYIANTGVFNQNFTQNNSPGLEWPIGSYKCVWFTAGLTIAAKVNGQLRMAAGSYSGEYAPGYILEDSVFTNADFKHYRISRFEDPKTNPDYQNYYKMIPYGAPYEDVNNNGAFDIGIDIPGMKGANETVFICITDGFVNRHNSSEGFGGGTLPLMAEVRMTFWGNNTAGLEDVHFMKFEIINKSGAAWDSTYMSIVSDPDLGDATDDHIGCDTVLDMSYVYNSDNDDGGGGPGTYGFNPPAAGIKILKITGLEINEMSSSTYFTSPGSGGIICERDCDNPKEAYNYMKGIKSDGTPWINPLTMQRTKFTYPGDPETSSGWTEYIGKLNNCDGDTIGILLPSPGGDRRCLLSTGNDSNMIQPGDTVRIYAMQLVAKGVTHLNAVTELKKKARRAEAIFNACFAQYLTSTPVIGNPLPVKYNLYQNYPNPFNPVTTIRFDVPEPLNGFEANTKLSVYDISGREVITFVDQRLLQGTYEYTFDGTQLSSGVYFYRLQSGEFIQTKKMMLVK